MTSEQRTYERGKGGKGTSSGCDPTVKTRSGFSSVHNNAESLEQTDSVILNRILSQTRLCMKKRIGQSV